MKIKNICGMMIGGMVLALSCLLLFPCGAVRGATSSFGQAEEDLRQAEKDFGQGRTEEGKAAQDAAQKTGKIPWSSTEKPKKAAPETAEEARRQALQGSPETGYAGTWTDPANGDIITSVIAPTAPAQNYSGSYPIIVEPNVSGWNGSGASDWSGPYPQWPVTPDNPGWGGGWNSPPQAQLPPYPPSQWQGPAFYPHPKPPANFQPGYRPLRPGHGKPPSMPGNGQPGSMPPALGWQPGNNWQPVNPPSGGNWNPGNNWQPAIPPNGGNWNPGSNWQPGNPPSGNNWNPGNNWQPANPPAGGNWWPGTPPPGINGQPGNMGSMWHPGLDRPGYQPVYNPGQMGQGWRGARFHSGPGARGGMRAAGHWR